MPIQLRPHKVLEKIVAGKGVHALSLLEGPFSYIVFSYNNVKFNEDKENDHLNIAFEYEVHEVPPEKAFYDKKAFEEELGDFLLELIYYGLEQDKKLGYLDAKN